MAGRFASLSRSLMSSATARVSSLCSPPAVPRLRTPPSPASRFRRRTSFAPSRNLGELGCVQSLLPFASVAALPGSHLSARPSLMLLFHGINGEDG